MRWMDVCSLALASVYVYGLTAAVRDRGGQRAEAKLHLWNAPMGALLRRTGLFARMRPALHRQHAALTVLQEGKVDRESLFRWVAEGAGQGFGALGGFVLLSSLSGNGAFALIGLVLAAGLPIMRFKELRSRLERRRNRIWLELPELLNRMLLLVGAGENAMRALARSAENGRKAGSHPLYDQLSAALAAIARGEPMSVAMEEFGRRCAVPEAKLFATVLLMNARRGGESLAPAMRELSRTLWEKRKAIALTLGEQASSRLAFPMAVVFFIIMALTGAPALLLM